MPPLHNRVSAKELKAKLMAETEPRFTLSFYAYFPIDDPASFRDELYTQLQALNVFGRIYLAQEGINAQISVPQTHFESFKNYLDSIPALKDIRLNKAVDDDGKSFWVLKIKVRSKIVADGITDPNFSMANRGKYVDAAAFNGLTENGDAIVVDMRNHYEYEVGHFKGAIPIPSDTFRDQLPMAVELLQQDKDKNIIMYCTGGIRCEKGSAYLLHHGFTNVYHLEGGIIHYVNEVKQKGLEQKFKGKNFVFDNRLGERVTEDVIAQCHQCGRPADSHTNCANEGCHLLFIQCANCAKQWEGCCSPACYAINQLPAEERAAMRKGVVKESHHFNKAKQRLRPKLTGE